jgi:hypothetical protein
MGIFDNLRSSVLNWLVPEDMLSGKGEMLRHYDKLRSYVRGQHRKPIVRKPLQPDDNLAINLTGLIVDRSISLLFGKDVTFDLPGEGETPEDQYLDEVWKVNKRAILLHDTAEYGSTYGTVFVKIQPDGHTGAEKSLPRLIPLNPFFMSIKAPPDDKDLVIAYEMTYMSVNAAGNQSARKETTRVVGGVLPDSGRPEAWEVLNFTSERGRWEQESLTPWPYEFPPIVHWKNLPDAESCYGKPDIDDSVIALQDAVNFVASNIHRILRYHAHPRTWGRGFTGPTEKMSWGPDDIIKIPSETGQIANLEMQSDLASSARFMEILRQSLFDISRTVDVSSMADKLGALTNFGLRVLFFDAMNKLGTKRLLYGDGLTELNRRLLVLANLDASDMGEVTWQDSLPVNELDQAQTLAVDLASGIVSKQTASTKRGYNWTTEDERINKASAASDNIGAALLRAFNKGGGGETVPPAETAPVVPTGPKPTLPVPVVAHTRGIPNA